MNRKRYILFLIFFLIFPVFSLLAAAEKLLLWEAGHPEKAGKLFLAGSIHLGKKELFPLDRRYDEVLAKSDEMVFEVYDKDPSVTQKTAMEFIRKKAFYMPGKTLKQLMGEKELFLLDSFYKSRGNMLFMQNGISRRPWIIMLDLTQITALESKLSIQYGFEEVFRKLKKERPARGLEQVYTQLSMLEGTDEKILCNIILNGIKDPAKEKRELENILTAFRTGDISLLAAQTNEMAAKYPLFHKRLFLARNWDMAEKLSGFASEKKSFFVLIGAAHFAGKGNILELLKGKGFLVKQLDRTGEKGKITGEEADE